MINNEISNQITNKNRHKILLISILINDRKSLKFNKKVNKTYTMKIIHMIIIRKKITKIFKVINIKIYNIKINSQFNTRRDKKICSK